MGRNPERLSEIIQDLKAINSKGTYIPIESKISLLKNVDAACEEFQRREKSLDLLIMCPGYLKLSRQRTHFEILFHDPNQIRSKEPKDNLV